MTEQREYPSLDEPMLSLRQAAELVGMNIVTLREAIHAGTLKAYLPRDVPPDRVGRAGYRIRKPDLQAWFFGKQ